MIFSLLFLGCRALQPAEQMVRAVKAGSRQACAVCHSLFGRVQSFENQPLIKLLQFIAKEVCVLKKIQDANVCKGAVVQMLPFITHNVWERFTDPYSVCHKLRLCPQEYRYSTLQEFQKAVMADKNDKKAPLPTRRKVIRVGHISDLHVDFKYQSGQPARCNQPVCCRKGVKAANDSFPAGRYGSIAKCDLPLQTFNVFAREMQAQNTTMILWTGDNTAHDIWDQSQPYNNNFTVQLSSIMQAEIDAFVVPSAGNHESYPVNVYEFNSSREDGLKQALADSWQKWIGVVAAKHLLEQGYYAITIQQLGLRVISLNTQACNDMNWFLLKDPTDPGGMLNWLIQELKEAERDGLPVYVIGHIPTDCLLEWSDRYNLIVERFQATIRAHFFGHTHRDHFFVFRGRDGKPTGVSLVAPSLTTYSDKIPQFRVMEVDADTLHVLDYTQFNMDLRLKKDPATFEPFYTFTKAYNVTDLTVESMAALQDRLQHDQQLQKLYTKLKDAGLSAGHSGRDVYCETMAVTRAQQVCNGQNATKGKNEAMMGPWKQRIK